MIYVYFDIISFTFDLLNFDMQLTVDANLKIQLDDLTLLLHSIISSRRQGSTTGFDHLFQRLPLELIEYILELSELNMVAISVSNSNKYVSPDNADHIYLALPVYMVKSFAPTAVNLIVESKDQGWSSYPHDKGKRNSWTWGELVVEEGSYSPTSLAASVEAFRNIHAGKKFERQSVSFSTDCEPVKTLISLWKMMFFHGFSTDVAGGNSESSSSSASATTTGGISKPVHSSIRLLLRLRSCYPGWRISVNSATTTVIYSFQMRRMRYVLS